MSIIYWLLVTLVKGNSPRFGIWCRSSGRHCSDLIEPAEPWPPVRTDNQPKTKYPNKRIHQH